MPHLKDEIYAEVKSGTAEKQFLVLEYSTTKVPGPTKP